VAAQREFVRILGRRFELAIDGPVPPGRYEVRVWEGRRWPWRRAYLRAPIRGRTPDDARERALEVLSTYVGVAQFRAMVEGIVKRVRPASAVLLREDARHFIVTVADGALSPAPWVVAREDVLGPDADLATLRARALAYLRDTVSDTRPVPR
jgi:hypothetical protein